jgi:transcriptional regulator with XRE-family HTH domain
MSTRFIFVRYFGTISLSSSQESGVPTPLGDKIRKLRQEKRLSLDQLAAQAETSKSYLWELENRDTANPTLEKVQKIADVLGITSEFLLDTETATPSEDIADLAFFRRYQKLPTEKKQQLQDILKVLNSTGGKKDS